MRRVADRVVNYQVKLGSKDLVKQHEQWTAQQTAAFVVAVPVGAAAGVVVVAITAAAEHIGAPEGQLSDQK